MKRAPAIVLILLLEVAAFADRGPRFGPEFTFGPENMDAFYNRLDQHLLHDQPRGAKFKKISIADYESPNGWTIDIMPDHGVAEVRMAPMFVDEYERYAADIQDAIFVSAANEGMFPLLYQGGGHINLDVGYFEKQPPVLLRNFLVDWWNHSELALGVFSYDTHNGISLSQATGVRRGVARVIRQFDDGEFGSIQRTNSRTVLRFLQALNEEFHGGEDPFVQLWTKNGHRWVKDYEISFEDSTGLEGRRRIEIRSVRPQSSMDVWLRQISLIRDRIFYLKKRFGREPIAIEPSYQFPAHLEKKAKAFKLNPPIDPQEALRGFYTYLTEAGHTWSDHRDYLWPQWTIKPTDGPSELARFEKSTWFKKQETNQRCGRMLRKK